MFRRDPIFRFQLRYELRFEASARELYLAKVFVKNALNKGTAVLFLAMEGCNLRKDSMCHTNFGAERPISLDNSAAIIGFDDEVQGFEAQSYFSH